MKQNARAKRTVLLVDDDTSLLETLRDFLNYESYEVVTAASGEQALEELRNLKPDIIVLDMSMPGIGGIGFLERITNADGSTQYPVLVLTARATMAEFFASRQIDGFIAKPCAPDDLLSEINRILFLRGGEPTPATPNLNPVAALTVRRAILADGNAATNTSIHAELQRYGFHVEAVFTGAAALELAIMSKPDVLVMRLVLPEMNAHEVVTTLKRLATTKQIPIVVYGIDMPNVAVENLTQLDIEKVIAIKGCTADKVVNSALTALKRRP